MRLISFSDVLAVKESRRIEDRIIWVKTEPERSPISFSKSALFSGFLLLNNMHMFKHAIEDRLFPCAIPKKLAKWNIDYRWTSSDNYSFIID